MLASLDPGSDWLLSPIILGSAVHEELLAAAMEIDPLGPLVEKARHQCARQEQDACPEEESDRILNRARARPHFRTVGKAMDECEKRADP